jgi:hypothetical protein
MADRQWSITKVVGNGEIYLTNQDFNSDISMPCSYLTRGDGLVTGDFLPCLHVIDDRVARKLHVHYITTFRPLVFDPSVVLYLVET